MPEGLSARSPLGGTLALAGLALAFVIVPYLLFGPWFETRALDALEGFGRAGVALGSTLLLALDIFLPVPSSILAISTGALLGAPLAAAVIWIGLSAGCVLGYFAGRGAEPLARTVGGRAGYAAVESFMRRWGWFALVILRPVPVLAEVSVLMASACGYRLGAMLAATLPANLAIAALYATVGAAWLGSAPVWLLVLVSFGAPALMVLGARLTRSGSTRASR